MAVGTGTTMAGLLAKALQHQTVLGISALKMKEQNQIQLMLEEIRTEGKFELHHPFTKADTVNYPCPF